MGEPGSVGRLRTGSIRIVAGFWGVVGVLMIPAGVTTGRWWVLLGAGLLVAGSAVLWWASGQRILPEGRPSDDAGFRRANRLRLAATVLMLAGVAVTVTGFWTSARA